MYNTQFKVKYSAIETELMMKLNSAITEAGSEHHCEYDATDIKVVCNKLYQDELISVFYAKDVLDDKIDSGMKWVLTKMAENKDFLNIINSKKTPIYNLYIENENEENDLEKNEIDEYLNTVVCLLLFSEQLFYLTHKCICQQLDRQCIESDTLESLEKQFDECLVQIKNK